MIKEYSISGVRKYRVRDVSTDFVVHSTYGKHKIDTKLNSNDARSIAISVCREMGIGSPFSIHQIGEFVYFDAIV